MGHEFAGRRVDTGEPVVVNPLVSCKRCDLCRRGLVNVCRDRQILGIHRPGGFAELVTVPEPNCISVSESVPFTTLALAEPLANAVHALRLAQVHDAWPQRVGVIGCGALGMCIALVARARGIPLIEMSDLSPARLAAAQRAGMTSVGAELTGEYDFVFDTVGSGATRGASLQQVRPGGTAVWVGLHGPDADVDARSMIRSELRVLTTFCYDEHDFVVAAGFVQTLDPDWLASYPLAEGVRVFLNLLDGPTESVKSMLVR
jgi:threonine dehydrogenase-like Zn-dependent dehydrogenase